MIVADMESDIEYKVNEFIKQGKLNKVKKIVSTFGFCHSKSWQGGYTLLYWALEYNRTNIAKWLVSQNCQVNPDNHKFSKKTALHLAVSMGKSEIVKMLLKKGACVTVYNDQLENPLHISCKKCNLFESTFTNDGLSIIKLLLKYGASVNDKGGLCEETPLLFAMRSSKQPPEKVVKLLIDSGANVNDYDIYRKSALHVAVENGDKKMTKLLLGRKANVNVKNCNGRTPLHLAVRQGFFEIAKMLLVQGADVNDIIYDFEEYRWTALHIAVKNKDEKLIKTLLEYNANVNAKEDHYRTPLHIASVGFRTDIAKILLTAGAGINDVDKLGHVPLHLAVRVENEKMVECLLEHSANVNAKRKDGKSCVHFAAENKCANIAKILLSRGADINDVTADGCTALHFAAKKGSNELVELFLNLGMDVDVKTKLDDYTPLYYAVKKRRCQIAECLLYHGADVNVPVKVYQTLLRLAVYDMNKEMVQLLLNWNANINAEDNDDDETPLFIATDSTRYEDIPGCEKMRSIIDCLVMYIAKLVSENVYVSEQNLNLIKQTSRLQYYYEKCQKELANMKSKKIYDNISYYDILTKSTNSMVSYARNENIRSAFESSDYLNAFPIYASMMYKNYERGRVKKQLLEKGERVLEFLFKNNSERKVPLELPYIVNREILKYLNLRELRILSVVSQTSPVKKAKR